MTRWHLHLNLAGFVQVGRKQESFSSEGEISEGGDNPDDNDDDDVAAADDNDDCDNGGGDVVGKKTREGEELGEELNLSTSIKGCGLSTKILPR